MISVTVKNAVGLRSPIRAGDDGALDHDEHQE
jgi:hypothetical protein